MKKFNFFYRFSYFSRESVGSRLPTNFEDWESGVGRKTFRLHIPALNSLNIPKVSYQTGFAKAQNLRKKLSVTGLLVIFTICTIL